MQIKDAFLIPTAESQHSTRFARYLDGFFYSGNRRIVLLPDKNCLIEEKDSKSSQTALKVLGVITGLFLIAAVYKTYRCIQLRSYKVIPPISSPLLPITNNKPTHDGYLQDDDVPAEKPPVESKPAGPISTPPNKVSSIGPEILQKNPAGDIHPLLGNEMVARPEVAPVTSNQLFDDVQLPLLGNEIVTRPIVAPVPRDGIKVGLPNNGNTCWLNSVLKFLACTDFYDRMLVEPVPESKQPLQQKLRTLINELRRGSGGILAQKIYDDLIQEIQRQEGFRRMNDQQFQIGAQEESVQFLILLTQELNWGPLYEADNANFPTLCEIFESEDPSVVKFPNDFDGKMRQQIDVTFDIENLEILNLGFDLPDLIEDPSQLQVAPDLPLNTTGNHQFMRRQVFTRLPPSLMVYLKREVQIGAYNNGIPQGKVSGAVFTDRNHCIKLTEYEPNFDESGQIIYLEPKRHCYYRIAAALTHEGVDQGGHHVCEERARSGACTRHSDSSITPTRDATLGLNSFFMRLDLVWSEAIPAA